MSATVSLTVAIDPALKEQLKAFAQENQISLSQEVSQRLQASLETYAHPSVDNTDVSEVPAAPLTPDELKQIRTLLKKQKKKK